MRRGGRVKGSQPTLKDIADQVGVGKATVDRVMNERGGVSEATTKRVLQAARDLGLRRALPEEYRPLLRIEVYLPALEPPNNLNRGLERALHEVGQLLDRNVMIYRTMYETPVDSRLLAKLRNTRANAIIINSWQLPELNTVIDELVQRGVTVVTTVSDLPSSQRHAYVGIDQRSAGRTAAFLVSPGLPPTGRALILTYGKETYGHRMRVEGFHDCLQQFSPRIRIEPPIDFEDKHDVLAQKLSAALNRFDDVVVIYNTGLGNRVVADALARRGQRTKVAFVGHELTPTTRELLQARRMFFTIDQNPKGIAAQAIDFILSRHGYLEDVRPGKLQTSVPFSIFTAENIE